MKKLKRLQLAGKTYPFKIDLNVLEIIQENYGTIREFEMDILGLKYMKDKDGKQVYGKDGEPTMYATETSIKAIKTVLPAMINEGLEIEAEEKGKPFEPLEDNFVFRNCNISYELLGRMIHEELKTCFEVKK